MSDADGRGVEVLPPGVGKNLRKAARDDSHPVPEFSIPVGWERNEPMCSADGTEVGLRNEAFTAFIEVFGTDPLCRFEGPYYAERLEQVGPEDSFETRCVRRITGIEPGQVPEAIQELAEENNDE